MDFISEHQLFVCVLIGLIYVLIRYVIEWAKSALYVAARRGDLERVKRLVKLGWKVNAKLAIKSELAKKGCNKIKEKAPWCVSWCDMTMEKDILSLFFGC